jgi:3-oxoadipate enol-lactonase
MMDRAAGLSEADRVLPSDASYGFAGVNGTRLYYEIVGSGAPLVLVHGRGLDRRMWDDQMAAFSAAYRVIRYDARGFGKSSLPTEAPFRHADDLHALLDHLGVRQAHVAGLSMGGRIAVDFALLYPESTLSLVLVDASLDGFRTNDAWNASLDAIAERARLEGPRAGNELWLEHELFAPARGRAECHAKLEQIARESPGWVWLHDTPLQPIVPPAAERLQDVRVPTLVVVGDRDLPDFQRIADKLAGEIGGARKVVLHGAGHMSNMEQPAEFNAAVLGFLQAAAR